MSVPLFQSAKSEPPADQPGTRRRPRRTGILGEPLTYRVLPEADEEDGGFNVVIPAFPTAHTQGDTVEGVLANARKVIELNLGYLADRGLPIPHSDVENV